MSHRLTMMTNTHAARAAQYSATAAGPDSVRSIESGAVSVFAARIAGRFVNLPTTDFMLAPHFV